MDKGEAKECEAGYDDGSGDDADYLPQVGTLFEGDDYFVLGFVGFELQADWGVGDGGVEEIEGEFGVGGKVAFVEVDGALVVEGFGKDGRGVRELYL